MFSMAMWMAALVAPMQIFAGDQHGLNTLEHQPIKIMAIEGHYRSHPEGAPLILFGIPDDEAQAMRAAIEIPRLGSLLLKHDPDAPMAGLDTVPPGDRPAVEIVFWSFRIMVGLGVLMFALGLWSLLARLRRRLHDWRWLHRFALLMGPAGFVAVIAGWVTTEVGRQPWVIYSLLRTRDAVSPIASARSDRLADRLRHRLLRRLRGRHLVHLAADAPAAGGGRAGTGRGADPKRRHHACARRRARSGGGEMMPKPVIPAKAGISRLEVTAFLHEAPACAGATVRTMR